MSSRHHGGGVLPKSARRQGELANARSLAKPQGTDSCHPVFSFNELRRLAGLTASSVGDAHDRQSRQQVVSLNWLILQMQVFRGR
jgi:hypothetical protein